MYIYVYVYIIECLDRSNQKFELGFSLSTNYYLKVKAEILTINIHNDYYHTIQNEHKRVC
jgi:hypothetical protein